MWQTPKNQGFACIKTFFIITCSKRYNNTRIKIWMMQTTTSPSFISAAASGTNWRDISKKILEAFEKFKTGPDQFNIGFLYITDQLAQDAESTLNLFKSVTGIEHWVGSVGIGVCTNGEEYVDTPAISAMIGYIDPDKFTVFGSGGEPSPAPDALDSWLEKNDAMLTLVHADPMADTDPARDLALLNDTIQGFLVGGLSSSRHENFQVADNVIQGGISGLVMSSDIPVACTLTQGCAPIGQTHTITKAEDNVILEIDHQVPQEVFTQNLKKMVETRTGKNPDEVEMNEFDVPEEFKDLFQGDIHVAFPVKGSDVQDYLVRNIVGIDPDEGYMAISEGVKVGDQMIFVHRDDKTVRSDLSQKLVQLRGRVQQEKGDFKPKAAVYISCVARAFCNFTEQEGHSGGEMALIREITGDIPLSGFYASGEISKGHIYGYTGILILFL